MFQDWANCPFLKSKYSNIMTTNHLPKKIKQYICNFLLFSEIVTTNIVLAGFGHVKKIQCNSKSVNDLCLFSVQYKQF